MKRWHFIVILFAAVLLAIWLTGGFKKTVEKAPVVEAPSVPTQSAPAPTAEPQSKAPAPIVEAVAEEPEVEILDVAEADGVLVGLNPITVDSGYDIFITVKQEGMYTPAWPDGTNQTSVGYSNPEEYPDGRTFATRSQSNPGEIMVFVANCFQVEDLPEICQGSEASAIIGMVIGDPEGEYFVKLRDAELKTLTIPGGISDWRVFVNELAKFISANKGGAPVEILGPAQ